MPRCSSTSSHTASHGWWPTLSTYFESLHARDADCICSARLRDPETPPQKISGVRRQKATPPVPEPQRLVPNTLPALEQSAVRERQRVGTNGAPAV